MWADCWHNDQYHMATRMRLGAATLETDRPRALAKQRTGERCDAAIRGLLTHLHLCNCGPARQRPHTALKRTLTTELRRMHFEVDVERVVFLSPPQPESPQPESLEETNTVERKQKSSLWCRRLRALPGVRDRAIGLRGTLSASSSTLKVHFEFALHARAVPTLAMKFAKQTPSSDGSYTLPVCRNLFITFFFQIIWQSERAFDM